MLDFFNFQTSQNGVDYQEFYGGGTSKDWVKPRGAAMVCFLLIGAGAGGRTPLVGSPNGTGGGSGAITRWIGPAIFVPDVLRINIGAGGLSDSAGGSTSLIYQQKNGTGYTLLTANGAASAAAGASSSNNYFGAAGIFFSQGGTNGANSGNNSTAINSFLAGGGGGGDGSPLSPNGGNSVPLYGYTPASGSTSSGSSGSNGYFINTPVLLGVGGGGGYGNGSVSTAGGDGGIGCGGGGGGALTNFAGSPGGKGGDGAAFVWAW